MGLAELRLEAGLSQADVAKAMQTHQPNVARQERRPGDLHLSALRLWAAVLGCDVTKVMAAVDISNRRNHEQ
ncbi:MAG: helix-turn-helix transcriptional regulator [Comamonadaceae bacterium]|nr:helix-turn-helix transcriptional regulator [Comamonadaceae bacterium]